MKKLLSLLLVAVCCLSATATDVTFVAGTTVGNNTSAQGADEMSLGGVTVSTTAGGFNCTGNAYRLAKNSVTTISCASNITKIVMTCLDKVGTSSYGGDGFTAMDGMTVSDDTKTVTWTGNATSVAFTAGGHQVRVSQIVVTISGEAGVTAPSFDPAPGTYYGAQTVTITSEDGATIYYTTNGTEPTTSSNVYSAPLNIAQTTTVKAFAVKGGKSSSVVTAEYVISSATTVANVAAFKALEDGAVAAINNKLNVYYTSGDNVYAKDETGYICLYTKSKNAAVKAYKAGDVIPAGIGGTKTTYRDYILEMADDFFNVQTATEHATVEPEVVGCNAVTTANVLHYIRINNVTITAQETASYFTVKDANGNECTAYGSSIPTGTFDYIIAMITVYGGNPQLTVIETAAPPTEIDNLGALPTEAYCVNYSITNPVTVIAQSGPQLYVKDESAFMLVYDNNSKLTHEYKNGDVVSGVNGSITIYNGLSELVPVNDFSEGVAGPAVEPEAYPIEEVSTDMMHQYIKLLSVTMDSVANSKGRNFTLTDDTGSIVMRINGFDVVAPTDLDGHVFNVTGFVALYTNKSGTTLQIYPTEIEDLTAGILGDLNGDGNVNTGDVSALYTALLAGSIESKYDLNLDGNVNTGDVSTLYSIILGN